MGIVECWGSEELGLENEVSTSDVGSAEADLKEGMGATLFFMVTFLKRLAAFSRVTKGSSSPSCLSKLASFDPEMDDVTEEWEMTVSWEGVDE